MRPTPAVPQGISRAGDVTCFRQRYHRNQDTKTATAMQEQETGERVSPKTRTLVVLLSVMLRLQWYADDSAWANGAEGATRPLAFGAASNPYHATNGKNIVFKI